MPRNRVFNAKVSNRARLREADSAVEENDILKREGARTWALLAVVLGELGGECIIAENTLNEVGHVFNTLDYQVEDGPEPGTSIVRLVQNGHPFVRTDEPPAHAIDAECVITREEPIHGA